MIAEEGEHFASGARGFFLQAHDEVDYPTPSGPMST